MCKTLEDLGYTKNYNVYTYQGIRCDKTIIYNWGESCVYFEDLDEIGFSIEELKAIILDFEKENK